MKKIGTILRATLPAVIVIAGFCSVGQTATAQTTKPDTAASQDQMQQPDNQKPASETRIFAGKIVKHGNILILSDTGGKTYKLDDQQKAKEFVNKEVKVTGVLDDSTGVIRVTAIEPA
jgi:hypothetical protein